MPVFGFPDVPDEIDDNSKNNLARSHRNKLLAESDYTQMIDYPMADEERAAWAAYRQELRDLPNSEGWPNPVPPPKPGDV